MGDLSTILERIRGLVWGGGTLGLMFFVGIAITVVCRAPQIRLLPRAWNRFFRQMTGRTSDGDGSYRGLCTALAATVGTGNIAGVAGAIAIGGPGAVFWMLLSALVGMATKFAESTLAVAYHQGSAREGFRGGPMYYIPRALPHGGRLVAKVYCALGLMAAFGVGNATQVNAVVVALEEAGRSYGGGMWKGTELLVGLCMALAVVLVISGGAERIGAAAETLVPLAAGGYILLCAVALWIRRERLGQAIGMIFQGAICPRAVTGGLVGSAYTALGIGVSRGTFTNEAGMGTGAMAHGGASVSNPVEQGLMGLMEVFWDTVVICTMTALVILTSGVSIPYGREAGAELTARALSVGLGSWVSAVLWGCLCLFAFATILGWGLYAGRCGEFLLGKMNWRVFGLCQGCVVMLGVLAGSRVIWNLSEIMNGLMALPNLIALMGLLPELRRLTRNDEKRKCGTVAAGGTYENIHQCKPLSALSHAEIPPLCGGSGTKRAEDLPSEHWPAGSENP